MIIRNEDSRFRFQLSGNNAGVLMCEAAFAGNLQDIKRYIVNGVMVDEADYDDRTGYTMYSLSLPPPLLLHIIIMSYTLYQNHYFK